MTQPRVLVVDDDQTLRQILSRILNAAGYVVATCADGKEAMEAYRRAPFDLVLSDLYMPGVDGVETIIRLRQDFPTVRIIAMSGGGNLNKEDVLELAARVGAQATLPKPIDKESLLRTVSEVLGS